MKKFGRWVACVGLIACASVFADNAPRKTAVIDTGKGGIKLVVSVPGFANGPYDFAKNPGPILNRLDRITYGEVMFNAQVGETGTVVYQANVGRRTAVKAGDKPITAELLASEMLKSNGFTLDRAVKIDSPPAPLPGATVVSYKGSGYAVFDGKEKRTDKSVMIVTAVSLPGDMQGYALMATIVERNIAAFDAEPGKFENRAVNAFKDLFRNHQPSLN